MQIDPNCEHLITFKELAESLPRRRGDRPIHLSTIHRWRSRGLKGIRLEAIRIGGSWCTSREAFGRFASRLTAKEASKDLTIPTVVSETGRSKDVANEQLNASGW